MRSCGVNERLSLDTSQRQLHVTYHSREVGLSMRFWSICLNQWSCVGALIIIVVPTASINICADHLLIGLKNTLHHRHQQIHMKVFLSRLQGPIPEGVHVSRFIAAQNEGSILENRRARNSVYLSICHGRHKRWIIAKCPQANGRGPVMGWTDVT